MTISLAGITVLEGKDAINKVFWQNRVIKTRLMKLHCVSKKVPTFELSVALLNLDQFLKFLHCWKAYEICYKTYTTLPISPYLCCPLPWEIKNQIFGRYSAGVKENANKLHIYRL